MNDGSYTDRSEYHCLNGHHFAGAPIPVRLSRTVQCLHLATSHVPPTRLKSRTV